MTYESLTLGTFNIGLHDENSLTIRVGDRVISIQNKKGVLVIIPLEREL